MTVRPHAPDPTAPACNDDAMGQPAAGQDIHMLIWHAGFAAGELFGKGYSYTYDDVILHPGHIYFGAHEVRALPPSDKATMLHYLQC